MKANLFKDKLFISYMNKRGISTLVVAVLLTLLVIAALLIIWAVIRANVVQAGEKIEEDVGFIGITFDFIKGVSITPDGDISFVLERNAGGSNISGFLIVLYDEQRASRAIVIYTINSPLREFERKIVSINNFDYGELGEIKKIEIYATKVKEDGKVVKSPWLGAVYIIKSNDITNLCVNGILDAGETGVDCGGSCVNGDETNCGNLADDDKDCDTDCVDNIDCPDETDCSGGGKCKDKICQSLPAQEICDNGIDDDSDILIDCADANDCPADTPCGTGGRICMLDKTCNILQTSTLSRCDDFSIGEKQINTPYTKYTLDQSLVSSGANTCFNIIASNIILDGGGFTIRTDTSDNGNGISAQNVEHIVIENINVQNYSIGIELSRVNFAVVKAIGVRDNALGIYIGEGSSNTIRDSTFTNNDFVFGALYFYAASNNKIINNIFANNYYHGIYFGNSVAGDSEWNEVGGNKVCSSTVEDFLCDSPANEQKDIGGNVYSSRSDNCISWLPAPSAGSC